MFRLFPFVISLDFNLLKIIINCFNYPCKDGWIFSVTVWLNPSADWYQKSLGELSIDMAIYAKNARIQYVGLNDQERGFLQTKKALESRSEIMGQR